MANLSPFAALRPDPALAARLCELPYDVLSSEEARALAAGNPLSFFHVSKPEIDLEPDVQLSDDRVYAQGKKAFLHLITSGALRRDPEPSYYLYRQVMGNHQQTGLVAIASCADYLANHIRKHELTRPDKEDDRLRHIETLNAQTGPAFLTYRSDPDLNAVFAQVTTAAPEIDFVAADKVRHTSWRVQTTAASALIEKRFAAMPALYIADGHHRTAAAARICQKRRGAGGSAGFLSVLFPHDQVQILPYHRVLRDLNGMTPGDLLDRLGAIFQFGGEGRARPASKHEVSLYLDGRWHSLLFRRHLTSGSDCLEQLDVNLLQKHVLTPLFGIDNPRTSDRINFVGGIRGTGELERLVQTGEYACAFALFPTHIEELMEVAEAGGLMPPKSTWFEPKLRDGMFCHLLS